MRLSGSPERAPVPGASGLPYSVVLEYGEGPVAGMTAFERNSVGDKDSFVAGKYSVGAWAVIAAYDFSKTFDGRKRNADERSPTAFGVGMSHTF